MTAVELRETVMAPEGVELHFGTASASERLVAFVIDGVVIVLTMLLLGLVLGWIFGTGGFLLVAFVVRHGYFIWFEARSNGRTLGKRLFHLRVIRADGGPLSTEILLARNLTREVEFFLPLMLLLSGGALFGEHDGLMRLLASLWILLLLVFPLTNPRRLRVGDLLAGTRVVVSPPAQLLQDLAARSAPGEQAPPSDGTGAAAAEFRFTKPQLDIYGEHELQVLEDVLRKRNTDGAKQAFAAVTKSICKRIGYARDSIGPGRDEAFLRAFYSEQRQHLEHRLVLGRRRKFKKPKQQASPAKGGGPEPPPLPPKP